MHEFALAQAVIDATLRAAEQAGMSRITKIVVGIGELQQIERDCFAFALKEVMPAADSRLTDVTIAIETNPAQLRCRLCDQVFALADTRPPEGDDAEAIHFIPELAHAFIRCPRCRSADFEVLAGRGVTLQSLEGDQ